MEHRIEVAKQKIREDLILVIKQSHLEKAETIAILRDLAKELVEGKPSWERTATKS